MTIEQFRKHMTEGLPVENGSEAHLLMHEMSQEALRGYLDLCMLYNYNKGYQLHSW